MEAATYFPFIFFSPDRAFKFCPASLSTVTISPCWLESSISENTRSRLEMACTPPTYSPSRIRGKEAAIISPPGAISVPLTECISSRARRIMRSDTRLESFMVSRLQVFRNGFSPGR